MTFKGQKLSDEWKRNIGRGQKRRFAQAKAPKWGHAALTIVRKYHPEVTHVVDAKHSAVVTLTKADCKEAKVKAPHACALARAFSRKHDGAIISVGVAYLIDGKRATRYRVSSRIAREIVSFDRGQYFAPGTYRLSAPAGTERLGKRGGSSAHTSSGGGSIRRIHKTTGIRSLI